MAERREEVIIDFEVDTGGSVQSIEDLTKANKALREERAKLNVQTVEGRKRIQEINAQIDYNTNKIKDNVSAIEKQKINIGNYKSALDGVHPALGKLGDGLEKGTAGFKAMTLQALKFIATPIGAILAAIVAVFGLLKAAVSNNNVLLDKFENVTNAISIVLNVLVNRVGKLGEALIALFSGDFDEAAKLTGEAFSGLADEIGNAVKAGQLWLDLSRDLEDSQREFRINVAKTENEIKRLVVASKNRNLTLEQQEDLLRRAMALEEDLVKTREDLARRDLVITAKRLAAEQGMYQTSAETIEQFIERVRTDPKSLDKTIDPIIEKIEALETARGSSLAFQEKLENSLAAIQDKRADILKKQADELRKLNEEEEKRQQGLQKDADAAERAQIQQQINAQKEIEKLRIETTKTGIDKELGLYDQAFQDKLSKLVGTEQQISEATKLLEDQRAQDIIAIREKYRREDEKLQFEADKKKRLNAQKEVELTEKTEQAKLALTSQFLSAASSLAEEGSVANKFLASASALVNTYLAATAALASGSEISPIYGALSYANAILVGLQAVAKINGVEFAEGGWTGPGQKMKAVGVVHADEYVVPKRLVNSPAAQPHIASLERMRTGYADGGFTTNTSVQGANQSLAIANVLKNMPPMEVSVKEVTKVQNRIKVKEQISKR